MKITKLSLGEISDICNIRKILEVLAFDEGFSKIPREKILESKKKLEECKNDMEKDNYEKCIIEDNILHEIIINSSGNKWLIQIIMQLRGLIGIVKNINLSRERFEISINEHMEMIEAIINEDKVKSLKILSEHLENFKIRLMNSYRKEKNSI